MIPRSLAVVLWLISGVAFAAPLFYYYLLWMKGYGRLALGF